MQRHVQAAVDGDDRQHRIARGRRSGSRPQVCSRAEEDEADAAAEKQRALRQRLVGAEQGREEVEQRVGDDATLDRPSDHANPARRAGVDGCLGVHSR
jgi:hypothetical protein